MLEEVKTFAIEEDKKLYHKMSLLVHTPSPETKKMIQILNDGLSHMTKTFENHDEREREYWKKLDEVHESFHKIKSTTEKNQEIIKEWKDSVDGLTTLIKSSKLLKLFVGYILLPIGSIIGAIYAIKEWIKH